MNSYSYFAAKIDPDSMKVILHLPFQGFAEWFQESMYLIQSSTLLHLGLTKLSISLSPRDKSDSLYSMLPLKSCFTAERITMNTCMYWLFKSFALSANEILHYFVWAIWFYLTVCFEKQWISSRQEETHHILNGKTWCCEEHNWINWMVWEKQETEEFG